MRKLLQYIILILFVSVNSVAGAWYATYYNGDFNYVLATGRMGGCKYVKLDSVMEEYKDGDVSILSVDGITVVNADMCNLAVLENWACKYKYDDNDTKMYGLIDEKTYYYDLSGPAFNYRGATAGEIAYVTKYGNKFYGSLFNKVYFGEIFYRGFLEKKLDGIPSKILGHWEAGTGGRHFDFASDMIRQIDIDNEVIGYNRVNYVIGLNNLKGMNRYRINVDDGKNFDFYYYDLAKEKILVSWDSKVILHRTSDVEIGELLGGVYIGMPMKKVVDLYGNPTKTVEQNRYIKNHYFSGDFMIITECAGYVARVQISSGSKKKLDKSGLGLEKDFDKKKSWDSDSLDKFEKVYKPYVKILENGDKHTYFNRYIAGDGVVVVKQCRYEMRDIILVAESWLE